jgi:hypothetical protein
MGEYFGKRQRRYEKVRWKLVAPKIRMPHAMQWATELQLSRVLGISVKTWRLWYDKGWVPEPSFAPQTQEEYDGKMEDSDFKIPARWSRKQIQLQWKWMYEVRPSRREPNWWPVENDQSHLPEDWDLISSI